MAGGASRGSSREERGQIEMTEMAGGGVWLHAYGEAADALETAPRFADAVGLAAAFVDRVLEHALAVDEKISQLNTAWPHIVATYQARVHAEVVDRSLFLRRYQAAASGSDEGATLALPEMPAA
ncbi:hypothetical protein Ctob_013118 [Chrysochromulina tobinii]|uniref:Uncharacterized protein n=1 Tax=Chrysochromulina tobinii TaxID=1460289 RepID=A0A0M0K9C0_9EUKA|nr:hypothetical protein Ctob_013118 [Chrysochromulina tobinii]|eukprot:KOO35404.1 hypothetical protein Ctob_013118 [Chrysochromulina sp. CCMP291]